MLAIILVLSLTLIFWSAFLACVILISMQPTGDEEVRIAAIGAVVRLARWLILAMAVAFATQGTLPLTFLQALAPIVGNNEKTLESK